MPIPVINSSIDLFIWDKKLKGNQKRISKWLVPCFYLEVIYLGLHLYFILRFLLVHPVFNTKTLENVDTQLSFAHAHLMWMTLMFSKGVFDRFSVWAVGRKAWKIRKYLNVAWVYFFAVPMLPFFSGFFLSPGPSCWVNCLKEIRMKRKTSANS